MSEEQVKPTPSGPADGMDASPLRAAPDPIAAAHGALIDAARALAETLAQLDATAWRIHPLRSRPATP